MSGSAGMGGTPNAGASAAGEQGDEAAGASAGAAATDPFSCPSPKPSDGATCSRLALLGACAYDDGGCVCVNQEWSCYSSSDCPTDTPANQDPCTLNAMSCSYGDLDCVCSTESGWSCETRCPEAKPAAQDACTRTADRVCRYGDDDQQLVGFGTAATTCACNDGAFACFTQDDCPAEAPPNADACTMVTLACTYSGRQCTCGTDGSWSCSTDCPEATPESASACSRPASQACSYAEGALVQGFGTTGDTTCVCTDEEFTCYTAADCPEAAPESDSACTQLGLNCQYDDNATFCRCRTSTSEWSCSAIPDALGAAGAGGSGGSTP
ncbi:hypothetical protein ACFL5O_11260 [Myxococcota bacterium]